MANSKSEDLYLLIKSLSKSEKRSFRIFAQRIHETGQLEYMKLFDIMDKANELSDVKIMKTLKLGDARKYSNFKRHLYEQILISLRMIKKSSYTRIRVREAIDFSYILYARGFHMQALKSLKRAKALAQKSGLELSLLTILEIEKMIHSRHITRSKALPVHNIIETTSELVEGLSNRIKLSNLRLLMHSYYIEKGYVKNKNDERKVEEVFKNNIASISEQDLSKAEQVHLNQAYVWYYYTLNDFKNCYTYSVRWIKLFDTDNISNLDMSLYLRAYNYLLNSLFYLRDTKRFEKHLAIISAFRKEHHAIFDGNTKILSFLYIHYARLNFQIISKDYETGIHLIPRTLKRLKRYQMMIDEHKVMIFYFKIAWIYLRGGEIDKALDYILKIINMTNSALRKDIQINARLMNLMIHFELGNFELIPSLQKNYKRFILNYGDILETHKLFMEFLNKYMNAPILERKSITKNYIQLIKNTSADPYKVRALLYLDVVEWMKSITLHN